MNILVYKQKKMEKLNSPENLQTNFDDFVKKHKKLIRRFIKKKYQDPLSTAMINAFLKDKKCKYVLILIEGSS